MSRRDVALPTSSSDVARITTGGWQREFKILHAAQKYSARIKLDCMSKMPGP
ncbi:MAG: hypothetical protein R2873_24005 [Caldilineaceae bacterium]